MKEGIGTLMKLDTDMEQEVMNIIQSIVFPGTHQSFHQLQWHRPWRRFCAPRTYWDIVGEQRESYVYGDSDFEPVTPSQTKLGQYISSNKPPTTDNCPNGQCTGAKMSGRRVTLDRMPFPLFLPDQHGEVTAAGKISILGDSP